MADTETPLLQLVDQETGNNDNTWGDIVDENFLRLENAIAGVTEKSVTGGTVTLTDDEALSAVIRFSGVLTSYCEVRVPARKKKWTVVNDTTGSFAVYIKTPSGWGFFLPRGKPRDCFCDGTNVRPIDGAGSVPIGGIVHLGVTAAGWDDIDYLTCNGAAVSRAEYAQLYAKIGTLYGVGDGSTTFNVPNMQDRYLRGASGTYASGTYLASELASHSHTGTVDSNGSHTHGGATGGAGAHTHQYLSYNEALTVDADDGGGSITGVLRTGTWRTSDDPGNHTHSIVADGTHQHTFTSNATGGSETRPATVVALGIIRYQ